MKFPNFPRLPDCQEVFSDRLRCDNYVLGSCCPLRWLSPSFLSVQCYICKGLHIFVFLLVFYSFYSFKISKHIVQKKTTKQSHNSVKSCHFFLFTNEILSLSMTSLIVWLSPTFQVSGNLDQVVKQYLCIRRPNFHKILRRFTIILGRWLNLYDNLKTNLNILCRSGVRLTGRNHRNTFVVVRGTVTEREPQWQ